jgi:hypothetical protein
MVPLPLKRASTRHRAVCDEYDEQGEELEQEVGEEQEDLDPDDWELVASYDAGHGCEFDDEGKLHVYRRRTTTHDRRATHPERLQVYAAKLRELWRRK